MSFTHIQSINGHQSGDSIFNIPISPTQQSNLLVVDFSMSQPGKLGYIIDDYSNLFFASSGSYSRGGSSATGELILPNGSAAYQWYSVQNHSGSTLITIYTAPGVSLSISYVVNEYAHDDTSNTIVLDKVRTATNTSTSASVAITSSADNELIAAGVTIGAGGITPTPGTDYSSGGSDNQLTGTVYAEYRLAGTTSETAPASWAGSYAWGEIVSSFTTVPTAGRGFVHVQAVYSDVTSTPNIVSLNQATRLNNLIVVNIQSDNIASLTVTDNASTPNTYALALGPVSFNGGANYAYQYYGVQITGGATSLTVASDTSQNVAVTVDEFSGGMQSNATVFDTAVSTTGHYNPAGGLTVTLTQQQLPGSLATPTPPSYTQDPVYAPLLTPSSASNMVTAGWFSSQLARFQATDIYSNNGYLLSIAPNRPQALVFTSHKLAAHSQEVPEMSWGPAAYFAVIGGSYKALPSGNNVYLKNKTAYPPYYPDFGVQIPIYSLGDVAVIPVTIPATTQGNLVVLNVEIQVRSSSVISITDNVGNTYVAAHNPLSYGVAALTLNKWYGVQMTGGATVVTITTSVSSNITQLYVHEYAGGYGSNGKALDTVSTISGTGSFRDYSIFTVPPFAPSFKGEVIDFGMIEATDGYITGPNGYLLQNTDASYTVSDGFANIYQGEPHLSTMYKISDPTIEVAPAAWNDNRTDTIVPYVASVAVFNPGLPILPGFRHVQGQANHVAGASSLSLTLNATRLDNLVVVNFYVSNPGHLTSVTDNKGNTYIASVSELVLPNGAAAYQYYGVQTVNGTTSITITLGSSQDITAVANEYSGGNTTNATVFDTAVVSTGTGTSSSISLSPAKAGELIDTGVLIFSGGVSPVSGSNYTNGGFDQANHTAFTEFRLAGTTSEIAPASWTGSSAWGEIASAFIPASPFFISKVDSINAAGVSKINGVSLSNISTFSSVREN
jgi:hypothetical protein